MLSEDKRKKRKKRKKSWLSRAGRMVSSDEMCCGNEAIQRRKEGELRVLLMLTGVRSMKSGGAGVPLVILHTNKEMKHETTYEPRYW